MPDEVLHDDLLLDRLVDGELTADERRQLLESLDARPDGWRRCALAFLEAQCWRGELREFVQEPVNYTAGNSAEVVVRAPAQRSALQHGLGWLAIAAAVLVAFTLGVIQRGDSLPIALVEPPADQQIASGGPAPKVEAGPEIGSSDDALTLWVRDDAGRTRPLRVPLMDASTLDRQLGVQFQSVLPAGLRDQLQQRGYEVQSRQRYAPFWLENGRPMIVPVEDTKIVPVGSNVY